MPTLSVASPDYVSGEVLIGFKQANIPVLLADTVATAGIRTRALKNIRAKIINRMPSTGMEHWQLPVGTTVKAAIKQLQGNPNVQYVEPNYRRYIRKLPNDPSLTKQWGVYNTGQTINDSNGSVINGIAGADMALATAWNQQTGSKNVIVAVVDDSIDINHPDLAANIWQNINEIPNDGIDNDGNGFIDDINGWDFKNNDNNPSADFGAGEGHGTAVAGCIGAVGNNGVGITGVNWNVSIMPLKFAMDVATEVQALDYAILQGAHIINASFGGPGVSTVEAQAITRLQNAGILFVAAAGNNDGNNDWVTDAPSGLINPNILAVAGSTMNDRLIPWSHYGTTSVDVAAPGEHIFTTQSPNGNMGNAGTIGLNYDFIQGTSFSSPYVAGVAALIKAQYPTATFQELKGRIMASVTPQTNMQGLLATAGRVNAAAALNIIPQPSLVISSVTWNDGGNGFIEPGETVNLSIVLENTWNNATTVSATLTALNNNLRINTATANYLDIPSGGKQTANFNVTASAATGHQLYAFRLDITSAGGYRISRYYQIGMGSLGNGIVTNGMIGSNDQDDYQVFTVYVPPNTTQLTVRSTANQDIDLMLTPNTVPIFDYSNYWQSPAPTGTQMAVGNTGNELITTAAPTTGTYTVIVLKGANTTKVPFTITAQVTVANDITPPVLRLLGNAQLSVVLGSIYIDEGATATDNVDGNITAKVVTQNTVNTTIAGTYSIQYNVSDAVGNIATTITRVVTVLPAVDTIKPVVTAPANITIAPSEAGGAPVSTPAIAAFLAAATATDNIAVIGSITHNAPKVLPAGATMVVTFSAKDFAGNIGTATATITVLPLGTGQARIADTYAAANSNVTLPIIIEPYAGLPVLSFRLLVQYDGNSLTAGSYGIQVPASWRCTSTTYPPSPTATIDVQLSCFSTVAADAITTVKTLSLLFAVAPTVAQGAVLPITLSNTSLIYDTNNAILPLAIHSGFITVNAKTINYQLNTGWNLLSFPVDLGVNGLTIFLSAAPDVQEVWQYSKGAWFSHIVGLPTFLHSLQHIRPLEGYWVKVAAAKNPAFNLTGSVATGTPLLQTASWNLIGTTTSFPNVATYASSVGASEVWGYNNGHWCAYNNTVPLFLNCLNSLQVKAGYYVKLP